MTTSFEYKSILIPIRGSIWTGTPKSNSEPLVTQAINEAARDGWRLHSQAFIPPSVWSGSYTGNLNLIFEREK